jgi:DNA-binding response OmpR family regulator
MPTLDGFETCSELRKLPSMKGVPILMLTALSQIKDVERAMGQGADGYIVKPVEVPKLREKVSDALKLPKA